MRDLPHRPAAGDQNEPSGTPNGTQDKRDPLHNEPESDIKPPSRDPLHGAQDTREVDPNDLQSLLDYRDERARAEARLNRTKQSEYDDLRRPGMPEPDRAGEPLRRPGVGRPVDPKELQSLLDYRDERARAEARLRRTQRLEHADRRRANVPERDDPSPETPPSAGEAPASGDVSGDDRGPDRSMASQHSSDAAPRRADPKAQDSRVQEPLREPDTPRPGDPPRAMLPSQSPDQNGTALQDSTADAVATGDRDQLTTAERACRLQVDFSGDAVADLGFHPADDRGSLGEHFRPGILDPHGEVTRKIDETPKVAEKELKIVEYLVERRGALVTILPEDTTPDVKNPDTVVRWTPADEGGTVELKTPISPKQTALEQNIRRGSNQVAGKPDPQLVIDGRGVGTTESTARGAWEARHRLSPSTTPTVHFILGDGSWLTLPEEPREKRS